MKFFKYYKKCCCCVDLRTGCIIIGALQIIGGLGGISTLFMYLDWLTIVTGIVNIASGACLLFGAIKYDKIITIINLICTAIAIVLGFLMAVLFFNGSTTGRYSDEAGFAMIAIVAIIAEVAIEIYFWLCIFSFYIKLKSGAIVAPDTHQPTSLGQPANQP